MPTDKPEKPKTTRVRRPNNWQADLTALKYANEVLSSQAGKLTMHCRLAIEIIGTIEPQTDFNKGQIAALQDMAGRFIQDSYWFGEDPATAWLLRQIAADLTTNGWTDVSTLRDKWRREKAEASK